MRPFAAVERFFERLFERPTARLFGARLQPVQIQRRLERAMENERLTSAGKTFVPNRYAVHLNPQDVAAFEELAEPLAAELADACLSYARQHRYTVSDRPEVALVPDDAVAPGDVHVAAKFVRVGRAGEPGHAGTSVPTPAATRASAAAEDGSTSAPSNGGNGSFVTADGQGPFRRAVETTADHTMVFEVPQVRSPRAVLRVIQPDGSDREISVNGAAITIGRGGDNDLVLRDARVSRHHARLQPRNGVLVLTDLGSTNGTRVNGLAVSEIALGQGDRIQLGDTLLIVEPAAGR